MDEAVDYMAHLILKSRGIELKKATLSTPVDEIAKTFARMFVNNHEFELWLSDGTRLATFGRISDVDGDGRIIGWLMPGGQTSAWDSGKEHDAELALSAVLERLPRYLKHLGIQDEIHGLDPLERL